MKIKIKDPIYHAEIYLFMSSYEEFEKYLKKYDANYKDDTDHYHLGKAVQAYITKNGWRTRHYYLWLRSFDFYDSDWQTLVLEIIHIALRVFDMKGIEIVKDLSNEPLCYYVDYLLSQFLHAINKANNQPLKPCQPAMDYMKENLKIKKI